MKLHAAFVALFMLFFSGGLLAQQNEPEPVYNETIEQPIYYEPLEYPRLARQSNTQGIVVIRAKLDREGKVLSAVGISGPRFLIPVCLSNIKKWQFRNTSSEVVILYDFRLEGFCVSEPCQSLFTFRPSNVAVITAGKQLVDHLPSW